MKNFKIHFGKNISFQSNLVELLSPSNLENNILYVQNNQLKLLPPGQNNQYLHLNDGGIYEWKYISHDFEQGVWVVALFSDQYQTLDGYGSAIDINPSGEYTYPLYMTMPYINCPTISPTGWIEAKESINYYLTPYPNLEGLAEQGGAFFLEKFGNKILNVLESNINVINVPIISINPSSSFETNIPNNIFEEEVFLRTSPYYLTSSNNGIWKVTASDNYGNSWDNYKIFNKSHRNKKCLVM